MSKLVVTVPGAGPWIRAHTSTLVDHRPPRLMHTDMGLRNDERWLGVPNDGALPLRVGEVSKATVRLSNGQHALMYPRRCQAPLAHRALWFLVRERLQQASKPGGGLDLLRGLVNGRFRSPIWRQRCVVRLRLQVHAVVWYWDIWRPCVGGRRALRASSL